VATGREVTIRLPYPPSVNGYWIRTRFGMAVGARGKKYRGDTAAAWMSQGAPVIGSRRLIVAIEIYPPNQQRRDLDNICKALLDALTACGLWADDEQIDELRLIRRGVLPPGQVIVRVQCL